MKWDRLPTGHQQPKTEDKKISGRDWRRGRRRIVEWFVLEVDFDRYRNSWVLIHQLFL